MNKYQEALEDLCVTYDENNGTSLGDDHLINNPLIKIIKEGLDKETPKKPYKQFVNNGYCPNCRGLIHSFYDYCCWCGQKLDWSYE